MSRFGDGVPLDLQQDRFQRFKDVIQRALALSELSPDSHKGHLSFACRPLLLSVAVSICRLVSFSRTQQASSLKVASQLLALNEAGVLSERVRCGTPERDFFFDFISFYDFNGFVPAIAIHIAIQCHVGSIV